MSSPEPNIEDDLIKSGNGKVTFDMTHQDDVNENDTHENEPMLSPKYAPKSEAELMANLDADLLLDKLGNCNWRIILYLTLINLAWILFAVQTLIYAFIADVPPYDCLHINHVPENISQFNFTQQCDHQEQYCGENGTSYFVFSDKFGYTLTEEWNLVCKDHHLTQLPVSIFQIGGTLSMLIVTQLSDAFGRHLIFSIAIWTGGLFGVAAALAPSMTIFAAIRFVTGVFSVGLSCVSWVYSTEVSPPKVRGIMPLYMNIIWNIGYCGVGIAAMYVKHWRVLLGVMSAPFMACIVYHWVLPESLHWLVAKNKKAGIEQWIKLAEKSTGTKLDLRKLQKSEQTVDETTVLKRTIIDLFRNPVLFYYMIVFAFLTSATLVYWGLSLFSTGLSNDRYVGFLLSGLIEIPAGIVGPLLLFWFGRRTISIASFLLSGASLCALAFVPDKDNDPEEEYAVIRIVLSLIGKFGNMIVFSSAYLLMPEALPTTLRNVGYGVVACVGKIGGIVAPYCGLMAKYNPALPPAIFGIMSAVAGILCITLPETANQELPEDIDDVDPGPMLPLIWPSLRQKHQLRKQATSELKLARLQRDNEHDASEAQLNGS